MTKTRPHVYPASSPAPIVSIDPYAVNARYQLLVALTWPRSLEHRNQALATFAVFQMEKAELEATNPQASDVVAMKKYVEDHILTPAGGYPAVAQAVGIEQITSQIARTVRTIVPQVGAVLHFAAQLDRHHSDVGASLRRAWEILKAENRLGQPTPPIGHGKRKKIQDDMSAFRRSVWNEWACNAPLCAAYMRALTLYRAREIQQHGKWDEKFPEWSPEEIGIILGWANWFRDWATGFSSPRSPKPFLPGDETVIIEPTPPALEPQLDPLSPERLQVARSYHWRDD